MGLQSKPYSDMFLPYRSMHPPIVPGMGSKNLHQTEAQISTAKIKDRKGITFRKEQHSQQHSTPQSAFLKSDFLNTPLSNLQLH